MKTLRSSWNSDRIAAALCNRPRSKKCRYRPADRYAQFEVGTDTVSVITRRGRTVFTRRFGDGIFSACVSGPDLTVETVNGGRFVCDAETGELLEARPPLAVALPLPTKIVQAA